MTWGKTLLLIGALASSACSAAPSVRLPELGRVEIDQLLGRYPMPSGVPLHPALLQRGEFQSYHLVQIRTRETPHRHVEHDLSVTLLRGEGVLHVAGKRHAMRQGDAAVVGRGEAHWFENRGSEPAAAFVIFSPPYDGKDNVPLAGD